MKIVDLLIGLASIKFSLLFPLVGLDPRQIWKFPMLQELNNPEGNAFMEKEASTAIWFVVILVTGAKTRLSEESRALLLEV